jgi:hypothetical protein
MGLRTRIGRPLLKASWHLFCQDFVFCQDVGLCIAAAFSNLTVTAHATLPTIWLVARRKSSRWREQDVPADWGEWPCRGAGKNGIEWDREVCK